MKTPLGRVYGLGSSKEGTGVYLKDRLHGVLLLVLTPFMVIIGVGLFESSHDEVLSVLSSLWVAPAMFVFLALSVLHMRHGMQSIIEDYIHHTGLKITLMFLNSAFCIAVGATVFLSLIRIFFQHH